MADPITPTPSVREVSKEEIDRITRALMDAGKIIEAGWRGLELLVVPKDAPDVQRREMRMAFFAGAQHLFSSIMGGLEEDHEPTENDLRRLDFINKELAEFAEQFKRSRLNA